jgi:nitroreductase
MEAGHAAQNVYLMATALGLGTVVVGAFHDDWVASVVKASKGEAPLYVIPVGVPKEVKHPSFQDIDSWYSSQRGEG